MGRGLDIYSFGRRAVFKPHRGPCPAASRIAGVLPISVAIARGKHLFPFRTEQLSPSAPMVLGAHAPGRVGRRRSYPRQRAAPGGGSSRLRPGPGGSVERPGRRLGRAATRAAPQAPRRARATGSASQADLGVGRRVRRGPSAGSASAINPYSPRVAKSTSRSTPFSSRARRRLRRGRRRLVALDAFTRARLGSDPDGTRVLQPILHRPASPAASTEAVGRWEGRRELSDLATGAARRGGPPAWLGGLLGA